MMTSLTCLCAPLLCGKCPTEYKSLTQLKQHLRSKYRASRRQTLIVSQKHLDLQINCKKCIETDHATGKWIPSICFPTDKVLQDHMEVAHKILNISKNEQSSFGNQDDTCVCVKAFQCHICHQSYYESLCLEKHWQESGHQPENGEALLSDLQSRAKVAKANCKKCLRETPIKRIYDVCLCRKTFICSVCLSTFDCYPSLKKHWKMTNYHSDQDSRDVFTELRGEDCPVCSPHKAVNCAYPEEESTDSFCSIRDAPENFLCKVSSPDAFHLKVDKVSGYSGVPVSSQYSSQNLSSKECSSQSLDQMMAIDTDDTDYGSDGEDFENTSTSYKQLLPLPEDTKCTCPSLKCSHCSCSFSKCRDLYQHMKDLGHLEERDFQILKKRKKDAKSFCCKHSNWEIIKEKKMKTKHSSYEKICDTNGANDIEKMEFNSRFLNDIPKKTLSSTTKTKKSFISNTQSSSPFRVAVPSDTSINYNKDASKAKVIAFHGEETTVFSDSPVIVMKDVEEDLETDDTLVTITIFENGLDDSKRNMEVERSSALQILPISPSSKYPFDLKSCFQQCLKLVSMDCTCEKVINASSSRVAVAGLNKTKVCPTCCLQMNCFMCLNTYSSYIDLKEHFIKDHSLQHNANKLSNPSPEYVEIVSMPLEMLDCSCTDFECEQCKLTFKQRLALVHHSLLDHPHFYPTFSFSAQPGGLYGSSCPQCTVLEKLCDINYYLFIKVLLKIEGCSDEVRAQLLQWCPSGEPFKNNVECESKNSNEDSYQEAFLDNVGDTEVVCYSVMQQTHFGKIVHDMEKGKHVESVECICPILKCPDCPKTTTTFGDLRKHVRLNDHNNWNKMRLLWKKYKAIKENCPSCHRFSYTSYVLCPHCPHLSFEDEDEAKAHMDSLHQRHVSESRTETMLTCTCSKLFLCMICETYYRTPQGLHHHMRRLGHETRENFDAIPRMIKERIEDKRKCARCSLFTSSKALVVRSDEDQEQCSCKWAVCNMCGNSYKKISVLIDHMRKMKHPVDLEYIERERKKLNASFKSCQKCNSMEDRYCIFCNTRENFIYHHIKTHHQDQQILVLNGKNYELKDEYDIICENKDFAKYECSICLKRFLHTTTLRHHVRKIHPDCYFTLQCLDLSTDTLKMENFAIRKEIRVLAIVSLI